MIQLIGKDASENRKAGFGPGLVSVGGGIQPQSHCPHPTIATPSGTHSISNSLSVKSKNIKELLRVRNGLLRSQLLLARRCGQIETVYFLTSFASSSIKVLSFSVCSAARIRKLSFKSLSVHSRARWTDLPASLANDHAWRSLESIRAVCQIDFRLGEIADRKSKLDVAIRSLIEDLYVWGRLLYGKAGREAF